MTAGTRVQVIELLAGWDATHHRLGTTGTITRIDRAHPDSPYIVTHDDGEVWRYGRRSLQLIGGET